MFRTMYLPNNTWMVYNHEDNIMKGKYLVKTAIRWKPENSAREPLDRHFMAQIESGIA